MPSFLFTGFSFVRRKTQSPAKQVQIAYRRRYRWYAALLIGFTVFACGIIAAGVSLRLITLRRAITVTPPSQPLDVVRAMPELILSVGIPYIDASPIVDALCFDFLKAQAGRAIVLDTPNDLTELYEQADRACSTPIIRYEFDFSRYQVVGAVTTATGCSLNLDYAATIVDDLARSQTVELTRRVVGNCGYELVRPIWLAIERNSYDMSITIRD
jgi:hypothetical protein